MRPRATGELHTLLHENFFVRTSPEDDPLDPTAGRMNFNATGVGFDIGFGAGSRLETRVGVDYALVRALTEDRYNEDEFGLPIEQDTELAQWSVHGELALALAPRGRAIGQYVWIPSAVVPYVGAGAGFVRYSTVMDGRFVDVVDFTIFSERIQSQGWAPSVHAFGGVDFRLTRNVLLTTEARYAWATAELDGVLAGIRTRSHRTADFRWRSIRVLTHSDRECLSKDGTMRIMRLTPYLILLIVGLALPAAAQNPGGAPEATPAGDLDARWLPWMGCWQLSEEQIAAAPRARNSRSAWRSASRRRKQATARR